MTRRALTIGINGYPAPYALEGCHADAWAWAAWLASRGFVTDVRLDLTAGAILDAVRGAVAASRAGDALVIVYSGHGTHMRDDSGDEPDGRDEALVGVDLAPVPDDALRAALAEIAPGVNATAVLDCCHSGGGTRLFGQATRRARYLPSRALAAPPPRVPRALERSDDVRWSELAACASVEVAYESNGQGDFTRAALAELRAASTLPAHGTLVRRVLARLGAGRMQTPQARTPVGGARRTFTTRVAG